jgi:hypothetical protein
MRTSQGNIGLALLYNEEYLAALERSEPFACSEVKLDINPVPWINKSK